MSTFWSTTRRREGDLSKHHWEQYIDGKPTGIYSNSFESPIDELCDDINIEGGIPTGELDIVTTGVGTGKSICNTTIPTKELFILYWGWRYGDEVDEFKSHEELNDWWEFMTDKYDANKLRMKKYSTVKRVYYDEELIDV